uniref:Choline transporter-like protein n=1 Tax=Calcidiscus leptoporus TaxID=127549 RepID=A0A7S0NU97_9EUKA|mmetsp:Transcript_26811/g.62618  ORF Transcript_26811/g.62618 Transcript_26811/m.62618 type:complete len:344 (+) Transcript_26811:1085-2116(+)
MAASIALLLFGGFFAMLFVSTGDLQLGRPGFGHILLDGWQELILVFFCVATVWAVVFVRHVQYCTIGGAVSQWYFKRAQLGSFPVAVALGTTLRYHTGSVALGSLLITALKFVRIVFLFLRRRTRFLGKRCAPKCGSRFARALCCYVECCLACFEKCLRALCRYAYTQLMISGHPFCKSAAEAFTLLTANLAGAATLRVIAAAYLALGKLLVAAACGTVGALILLSESPFKEELYSIWPPVVAIVVIALAVSMIFFGVYNMTIDTIFVCVCIEKDRKQLGLPTDGSAEVAVLLRDPDVIEGQPRRAGSLEQMVCAESTSGTRTARTTLPLSSPDTPRDADLQI